jgi:hypothetical protein
VSKKGVNNNVLRAVVKIEIDKAKLLGITKELRRYLLRNTQNPLNLSE